MWFIYNTQGIQNYHYPYKNHRMGMYNTCRLLRSLNRCSCSYTGDIGLGPAAAASRLDMAAN